MNCSECDSTALLRRHVESIAVEYELTESGWEYSKTYDGDRLNNTYSYECLDCGNEWEGENEE